MAKKLKNASKLAVSLSYDGKEKTLQPGESVSLDFFSTDSKEQDFCLFRFTQKYGSAVVEDVPAPAGGSGKGEGNGKK